MLLNIQVRIHNLIAVYLLEWAVYKIHHKNPVSKHSLHLKAVERKVSN